MELFNIADTVIAALKASESLENAIILKAFPFADKPTRLTAPVIAVSLKTAALEETGIGENSQYGSVNVRADIYCPVRLQTATLEETAKNTVSALLGLKPSGVSVSPVKGSDALNCLFCSCDFTFPCFIDEERE